MYAANEPQAKAVVSKSEMARMVGLSPARFAQLVGTTFPWPQYDLRTRRPFYPEELASHRACGPSAELRNRWEAHFVLRTAAGATVARAEAEEGRRREERSARRSDRRHQGPRAGRRHRRPGGRGREGTLPTGDARGGQWGGLAGRFSPPSASEYEEIMSGNKTPLFSPVRGWNCPLCCELIGISYEEFEK